MCGKDVEVSEVLILILLGSISWKGF